MFNPCYLILLEGTAVVTEAKAALWVDGRYHLQADDQTDDNWLVMKEGMSFLRLLKSGI